MGNVIVVRALTEGENRLTILDTLHSLTDDQLEAVKQQANEISAHRAWLDSRKRELAAISELIQERVADHDPVSFEPVPALGHPPGGKIISDGQVYVNVSGIFLDMPPHDCPALWAIADAPDEIEPDDEGEGDADD